VTARQQRKAVGTAKLIQTYGTVFQLVFNLFGHLEKLFCKSYGNGLIFWHSDINEHIKIYKLFFELSTSVACVVSGRHIIIIYKIYNL
jgi:hypothetical protein